MREVINVHIGQAGIQMGTASWQQYNLEHNIGIDGKPTALVANDSASVFYHEAKAERYVPRALFVDLEPSVIDETRRSMLSDLIHPNQMISGKEDAANNYARGYYTAGKQIIEKVIDKTRLLVEQCDNFQGFLMHRSLGGGTGSGTGSALLERYCDEFSKKMNFEFTVNPSAVNATAIVEPFNAALATPGSLRNVDLSFILDNQAMFNVCKNELNLAHPSYSHLNQLKAQAESSITASLRFNGMLNVDLQEFQTNMVPYPNIHFPVISYAPMIAQSKAEHESFDILELTRSCFQPGKHLTTCDPSYGKYMACCVLFRGDVNTKSANEAIKEAKLRHGKNFVDWSPCGFKVGISNGIPKGMGDGKLVNTNRSVCLLSSTTAVSEVWDRLINNFDMMFKRRAYVHWYLGEGMEFEEFNEARDLIANMRDEYESLDLNSRSTKLKNPGTSVRRVEKINSNVESKTTLAQ